MTPKPVEFLPAAIAECRSARAWYGTRSRKAELGFLRELSHAFQQVATHPHRWASYMHDTQRYVFRKYPYSIVYQNLNDRVLIVAIQHQSLEPGAWSDRLP